MDPFKNEEIDLIKQMNEIYGKPLMQSLKPALDTLGKGISGIFFWAFYAPIKFQVVHEAELEDFTKLMAEKMKNIPKADRDSSRYGLVLEALQNSVYQLNEEELRKLFANLVAALSDKRKNGNITPRYVYILSQLGLRDALLLKNLTTQTNNKLYYVRAISDNDEKIPLKRVLYLSKTNKIIDNIDSSMNVLESLGIVKITGTIELSLDDEDSTSEVKNRLISYFRDHFSEGKAKSSLNLELLNTDTIITSFGREFLNCVVK